jgi:DNA-binding response OmpR family regulator
MNRKRILLVEDDPVVLKIMESRLLAEGFEVIAATDANQAMKSAQEKKPDLMVLDLTLINDTALNGILDGFGLLHWLRYTSGDTDFPVIIHTADTSPKVDLKAAACKVCAVFRKGDNLNELVKAVRKGIFDHLSRHPSSDSAAPPLKLAS